MIRQEEEIIEYLRTQGFTKLEAKKYIRAHKLEQDLDRKKAIKFLEANRD